MLACASILRVKTRREEKTVSQKGTCIGASLLPCVRCGYESWVGRGNGVLECDFSEPVWVHILPLALFCTIVLPSVVRRALRQPRAAAASLWKLALQTDRRGRHESTAAPHRPVVTTPQQPSFTQCSRRVSPFGKCGGSSRRRQSSCLFFAHNNECCKCEVERSNQCPERVIREVS